MNSTKRALITGGNRGLGLETARQLGQKGFHVVIGARSAEKGEAAAAVLRAEGLTAEFLQLDVESDSDIQSLPERIGSSLDVLVNNAGVFLDKNSLSDSESMRRTFNVNVVAPHAITMALKPILSESPAGRIVHVSSILGSMGSVEAHPEMFQGWLSAAYGPSKSALNMLTLFHVQEFAGTNVKVNSAHPGWVKTELGGSDAPVEIEEGVWTAVWLATLPESGPTGGFFHRDQRLPW